MAVTNGIKTILKYVGPPVQLNMETCGQNWPYSPEKGAGPVLMFRPVRFRASGFVLDRK